PRLYRGPGDGVSGSDLHSSPVTDRLAASGAAIFVGHEAANVGDVDQVVTSTAIRQDNPELVEARRRGLQVVHRGAAAAQLCGGRRQVAIDGTHGKTTTTSMVAWGLQPLDPLLTIGCRLPGHDFNAR